MLADAAWVSFVDKKEVGSADVEHSIQKTLQNIHWERKPRAGCRDDVDEWDATRRRGRAFILDDDDDNDKENGTRTNRTNDDEDQDDHDLFMQGQQHAQDDMQCSGRSRYTTFASQGPAQQRM